MASFGVVRGKKVLIGLWMFLREIIMGLGYKRRSREGNVMIIPIALTKDQGLKPAA